MINWEHLLSPPQFKNEVGGDTQFFGISAETWP